MDHVEIVTPPAGEPLTLDECKEYLRVDVDDEDGLIGSLLTAARMYVETRLRQTILTTVYDWFLDGFPQGGGYYLRTVRAQGPGPGWLPGASQAVLLVPRPPLVSVESIQYRNPTGEIETLDPSRYRVSTGWGSRVAPETAQCWPPTLFMPQTDNVIVRYTAGRPTPADVPAPILTAIKLMLSHWFENRDTIITGTVVAPVPDAVEALLATVSHWRYA